MSKIRVAQVIAGTDVAGAKGYTIQLVKMADKSRFEMFMINVLEGMTTKEARMAGVEPFMIPQNPFVLAKLMKNLKLDLIHTHGVRANFLGRAASRKTGIPSICTMHSDSRLDYESSFKERAVWFADNVLNRWTNGFIGVSDDMSRKLVARGIPADKVHTVHNGVDLNQIKSTSNSIETKLKLGIPKEYRLIGTVGRLVEVKGHADLITAMPKIIQKVPDAACVIVGDGRCFEPLKKQAEDMKVSDRVFLTGRIKDPFDLMKACEVGVFPSLAEAIGLALLEYMALEVPVVATNVGGIPEVITSNDIGLLVQPSKPTAFADAVIDLMCNRDRAVMIGKNGRERVKQAFTIEDMIRKTEVLWEKYALNQ